MLTSNIYHCRYGFLHDALGRKSDSTVRTKLKVVSSLTEKTQHSQQREKVGDNDVDEVLVEVDENDFEKLVKEGFHFDEYF